LCQFVTFVARSGTKVTLRFIVKLSLPSHKYGVQLTVPHAPRHAVLVEAYGDCYGWMQGIGGEASSAWTCGVCQS
jgi:hypothetical protein